MQRLEREAEDEFGMSTCKDQGPIEAGCSGWTSARKPSNKRTIVFLVLVLATAWCLSSDR